MKKTIFSWFVLCLGFAHAQTITVSDLSSREPISGVVIYDKHNQLVMTDASGRANLSALDKTSMITLSHSAYQTYVLSEEEKQSQNITISLLQKSVVLDEVILSANRFAEHKIDVPYSVMVISQKEIEFSNQQTSADLLQNTGAVFVQKSQMGGGSPILRGFEANKVLIVVDGVRMNNAIYRGGHLQDIITLDANMLERTEVLFGPASTIYGSDALGGVMHFYTKNARFSNSDKLQVSTNAFARYSSANMEKTGHLDFNLGWKNFASMTNLTYSDFGDLMSGSTKLAGTNSAWDRNYYAGRYETLTSPGGTKVMRDTMMKNSNNNLQVGTAYSQLDLMQRFALKSGRFVNHNLNFQYSQSSNIPRYDRLTEMNSKGTLKFAEWNYGPQTRLLAAYTFNFDKHTLLSDNVRVIGAYQQLQQDRISRSFQNNNRKTQMEDVTVISINADIFKKVAAQHELRYGAELQLNNVVSTANNLQLVTGELTPAQTRYADGGNTMNTMGLYFSDAWELTKNFVISGGLRFTANQLVSEFKDTTFIKLPFTIAEQNNQAFTGNLGFTWKEDNDYKVSLLMNTGFRTPNIDDMSKVFESSNSVLIVPNPDARPEYATNFELNMSKVIGGKFKFDFTGFYTLLEKALVQADFVFNGNDTAIVNGDTMRVQAMQNKNSAYIYGCSAGAQFDFNRNLSFKTVLNYTYGRYSDVITNSVSPLDHIPPVFGQTSLIFKEKNLDAEFFVRYNSAKRLSDYSNSGEDNLQYATPNGMPGWFTLNCRFGYSFTKNFRLNAACENITNNRYRVFASGVNAPGRNIILSLRYKL